MQDKIQYVIVFIPAFNEEESIGKVIKNIREIYQASDAKGFKTDIIVVDDGSSDRTEQAAKGAGVKSVIKHPFNQGLGASTRTGLKRAYEMGADIAVKIDADFQHDPKDIEKVIRPILSDEADAVFGSRFLGKVTYRMPFHRRMGNTLFSYLVSRLTGLQITDGQTGLMAFSRRYLSRFNIISNYNETQQLIIDSWRNHMRIIEVPVFFHARKTGRSFISFRYPFKVLPTLIRLFVHTSPLKVFVPLGIIFILAGLIVAYTVISGKITFIGDATIVILLIGGVQIIIFGLLADAISKKE